MRELRRNLPRPPFSPRNPLLSQKKEAIDPPTHPNTWVAARVPYVHRQTQQGPLPKPTVGSPGEASCRRSPWPPYPLGSLGPDSASRGQSWSTEARRRQHVLFPWGPPPGRCRADGAAFRVATLQGRVKPLLGCAGDKLLGCSVLRPAPLPSPEDAGPCLWRRSSRSVRQGSKGGVISAWGLGGPPACALSALPSPAGPG